MSRLSLDAQVSSATPRLDLPDLQRLEVDCHRGTCLSLTNLPYRTSIIFHYRLLINRIRVLFFCYLL
jgi:hypothetical protein